MCLNSLPKEKKIIDAVVQWFYDNHPDLRKQGFFIFFTMLCLFLCNDFVMVIVSLSGVQVMNFYFIDLENSMVFWGVKHLDENFNSIS